MTHNLFLLFAVLVFNSFSPYVIKKPCNTIHQTNIIERAELRKIYDARIIVIRAVDNPETLIFFSEKTKVIGDTVILTFSHTNDNRRITIYTESINLKMSEL